MGRSVIKNGSWHTFMFTTCVLELNVPLETDPRILNRAVQVLLQNFRPSSQEIGVLL